MVYNEATLNELAKKFWTRYQFIFPKLVQFPCPKIVLSNRLSKTAGLSHCEDNKVTLAAKFLAKFPKEISYVTLPHELAHQIDFNLNGWYTRKPHHGKQWIEIMVKIGQEPEPYHKMVL